jgi:hypothetical protein
MMEVAAVKVSDRAKADMRMRPNIDAVAGQQLGRPSLVEEDERANHLPLRRWQSTPNLKAAKVAGPGNDEGVNRVKANIIGASWFDCWVPTHARDPLSRWSYGGGETYVLVDDTIHHDALGKG